MSINGVVFETSPGVECEHCLLASMPCTVSHAKGRFKQIQYDACVLNGGMRIFIPRINGFPPFKLPKSCIHYQSAHQICKMSVLDHQCDRRSPRNLMCVFVPSLQGTCEDIKMLW